MPIGAESQLVKNRKISQTRQATDSLKLQGEASHRHNLLLELLC